MHNWEDVIVAIATPATPALRGILRFTGPNLAELLQSWLTTLPSEIWTSRTAVRVTAEVTVAGFDRPLPADLQWWPTQRSYTGQPSAELHLVGSPPILSQILAEAYERGCRAAAPGEFTLRAFLAGRLDLLQAEAVLGVIDAHDQLGLEQALQQLAGGVSQQMLAFRNDLLELLADLEAGLDFVEEHLEFVERQEVQARLDAALHFLEALHRQTLSRMHAGERMRVVLAGLPNAGKSTLFNRLTGQDLALVSPQAGTTRDYLTAGWNCCGMELELIDTAGWEIEHSELQQSMQAARERQLQRAQLIIWCSHLDADATERAQEQRCLESLAAFTHRLLPVCTKSDLCSTSPNRTGGPIPIVSELSAMTGAGLREFEQAVSTHLQQAKTSDSWVGISAARCQAALRAAVEALQEAVVLSRQPGSGDELIAAELRLALDQLGTIVGVVFTDDLLDRIFSKFCIGK